jgi:hypothetical protein
VTTLLRVSSATTASSCPLVRTPGSCRTAHSNQSITPNAWSRYRNSQANIKPPTCCCTSARHTGQQGNTPQPASCALHCMPAKQSSHRATCRQGSSATLLGASKHTTQSCKGQPVRTCCLRMPCAAAAAAASAADTCNCFPPVRRPLHWPPAAPLGLRAWAAGCSSAPAAAAAARTMRTHVSVTTAGTAHACCLTACSQCFDTSAAALNAAASKCKGVQTARHIRCPMRNNRVLQQLSSH